jgi:hypothetical protein
MPKYRLNSDHYLHHRGSDGIDVPRHHLKGETVGYDGPPSMSMPRSTRRPKNASYTAMRSALRSRSARGKMQIDHRSGGRPHSRSR